MWKKVQGSCKTVNPPPMPRISERTQLLRPKVEDARPFTEEAPLPQEGVRRYKMYNRQAKGIEEGTWQGLMSPVDRKELLDTIVRLDKNKAAGHDGVSSDLLKLPF